MNLKHLIKYVTIVLFCCIINNNINNAAAKVISDPVYPNLNTVQNQLQNLANTYPAIIAYQELGTATNGSQPIMALKISDNVISVEDEPVWVFTGTTHGSEHMGLRILLDLADDLATGYGVDVNITNWIDAYEIWLIVCLNPWGYEHNSSGNKSVYGTRKNGRHTSDPNTSGVDLNRNFDFRWTHGGSGKTTSSKFRGPTAFSENETQAIRDLYLNRKPIFGVEVHQGNNPDGGQIMRP